MRNALSPFAAAVLSTVVFAAPLVLAAQSARPTGDPAKGEATFERTGCWECHGHQGQGGVEGPRIAAPAPALQVMSRYVRNPRRNMPPYTQRVLSDQELADIYAFLQSIPPAPDATTISLLSGKF
jgi:ubiquinol-cytochrome c reductase cytochrome c subunit